MPLRCPSLPSLLVLAAFVCAASHAWAARVGLVVGEPFGSFGAMMPQGHAGLYLADYCTDTAVSLRPCRAGETGTVISRYHDLRKPALDWLAIPFLLFLYGVESTATVPSSMDARTEAQIRERYRLNHLRTVVPDRVSRGGLAQPPPYGDWEEGIGAAFDRRVFLYVFEVPDSTEAAIAAKLISQPNARRYTLRRHNCADFAADLLAMALPPGVLHRNVLADFNLTTPKNLARELDTYGLAHPGLHLQVFAVPQLPGTLRRSRPLLGAAETLVTEKRYTFAVGVLQPEALLAAWVVFERYGKWPLGFDAIPLAPEEIARFVKPTDVLPQPLPAPAPPPRESASVQSGTD